MQSTFLINAKPDKLIQKFEHEKMYIIEPNFVEIHPIKTAKQNLKGRCLKCQTIRIRIS